MGKRTHAPDFPGLSAKEARFVQEFLVDSNGTQAAIRAGYSVLSARTTAARLLTKENIARAIAEGEAEIASKLRLSAEQITARLERIANLDIRRAFDSRGRVLAVKKLPDDVALAVVGVELHEDGTLKRLKFADRLAADQLLGRKLGMWKDKVQHEAGASLVDLLAKANELRKAGGGAAL